MTDGIFTNWHDIIQAAITGAAGLLGVSVGGWITAWNQRREREFARLHEQLMGFYAPMRGLRAEIRAKSEVRTKIHGVAQELWPKKFEGIDDPEVTKRIDREEAPKYEKIFDYSNKQLKEDLVPLYRKMLQHFSINMGLAELSTLEHYAAFVEFVELWNRALDGSLPGEVVNRLDHSETKVKPLYEDIDQHFKRLNARLKK